MTTEPLRTLGRYTLKRRLAAGGMGEVYLGEVQGAANFTKSVAIKRILPHLAANEAFVTKFIDEANVMVQLHHGNIVPVLELADEGGELFIVMEYLPGRDLKAVLHRLKAQRKPFPVDLALWVIAEICDGLDYAHRKTGMDGHPLHIVHRDVSPSNVMLGAGGEVKLVDFGIARARGGLHQSISGTLQGKFTYMSPEQAEGMHVDARSDIFSTGLVLYEMLTGVRPLEGESETETLRRVRQAKVPPPSTLRDDLPETVDGVLAQALAAEPTARYGSAAAMRRELVGLLSSMHSTADAAGLHRFLAEIFPEGVIPPTTEPGPLSLDDALKLQLGALTPSVDLLGHTQTSDVPAAKRPATFSTGDPPPAPAADRPASRPPAAPQPAPVPLDPARDSGVSAVIVTEPPRPRPITSRRSLAFVLGVAAAAVVAGLLWLQGAQPATVAVDPEPGDAVQLELSVDGEALGSAPELREGQSVRVCARARDFEDECTDKRLDAGENRVRLKLRPKVVMVRFEANARGARALVEGVEEPLPVGQSANLRLSRQVLVEWTAPGYLPLRTTHDLFELGSDRTIRATLTPAESSPPVQVSAPSAPSAPPTREAGPAAAAAKPRSIRIVSAPPGAEVFEGARSVGRTPLDFKLPRGVTTLTFKHAWAREASRQLDAATTSPLRVELVENPPGFVSVRANPPAATLALDGQAVENPLKGVPVPAGVHTLVARHGTERKTIEFSLKAGEPKTLPLIDVISNAEENHE